MKNLIIFLALALPFFTFAGENSSSIIVEMSEMASEIQDKVDEAAVSQAINQFAGDMYNFKAKYPNEIKAMEDAKKKIGKKKSPKWFKLLIEKSREEYNQLLEQLNEKAITAYAEAKISGFSGEEAIRAFNAVWLQAADGLNKKDDKKRDKNKVREIYNITAPANVPPVTTTGDNW